MGFAVVYSCASQLKTMENYSFMTMIAGINIHLDARLKVPGFSI